MNEQFKKPKGFGEILDHTFRLSKSNFTNFFVILLIIMGPIYLLQAIVELISGTSFFREIGVGTVWYEQIFSSFDQSTATSTGNIGADIGIMLVGLLGLIFAPIAQGAVLFAINHIRKNEEYTVGSVLKQSFLRFWPIFWSNILFGLITFGLVIVPIILVSLVGFFGAMARPIEGIIAAILLGLGLFIVIVYLLTRWGFYLAAVVLEQDAPGLSRSWKMTRNRAWVIIGLYLVFFLITGSISFAIELSFGAILGNSVLLSIIINMAYMLTTMIFSVGYAVMFFDAKIRHDADDLRGMIEEYNEEK